MKIFKYKYKYIYIYTILFEDGFERFFEKQLDNHLMLEYV